IARVFSGAKYVDEAYNKTRIGDRAILINTKDVFEYPPGYFSNPAVDPLAPQIIATATPVPLPPPPPPVRLPKVKPTPTPAPAMASASPAPSPAASPQASPAGDQTAGLTEGMTKEEQNKKLDDIAARNNIERPNEDTINKKPLKDWLAKAKEAKDKNEFDVTQPIEIIIEADRGPDGTLVNAQVVSKKGDPKLEPYVKDFIAALSDSRALSFLKDVNHIRLVVNLTETDVTVKVSSEVDSEDRASQIAKGYSILLIGGRIAKKGQTEEVIYKNTKISTNGKAIEVNFTMPRKEATDILAKLSTS
ncbi:MAG TPA: hypothetical protein VGO69_11755, partial [Pyrinomonadaceae bacterium]|nr:hypothetical protein [Pyrinomonadaceae bacterium]